MEKSEHEKLYESEKNLIQKVFLAVCSLPPLLYLIMSLTVPKSAIFLQLRNAYFQIASYSFGIVLLTLIWVFIKRYRQGRAIITTSKAVLKQSVLFTAILIAATLLLIYYQNTD